MSVEPSTDFRTQLRQIAAVNALADGDSATALRLSSTAPTLSASPGGSPIDIPAGPLVLSSPGTAAGTASNGLVDFVGPLSPEQIASGNESALQSNATGATGAIGSTGDAAGSGTVSVGGGAQYNPPGTAGVGGAVPVPAWLKYVVIGGGLLAVFSALS